MGRQYEGKTPIKNKKEELFCKIYAETLNGIESALKSGICKGKRSTAATVASQLKARSDISARIDYLLLCKANQYRDMHDKAMEELAKIAFSNIGDFVEFNKKGDMKLNTEMISSKAGSVIQELEISVGNTRKKKIKLYDKLKALETVLEVTSEYREAELRIKEEKHEAQMAMASADVIEVEDDGFLKAMNIASKDESFVVTEGADDEKKADKGTNTSKEK